MILTPARLPREARRFLEEAHPSFMGSSLAVDAVPARFADGEPLWSLGEPTDRVALLAGGTWVVSTIDRQGTPRVLDIVARGTVLGVADAFADKPRRTAVVSLGASVCLVLPADTLRAGLRAGGERAVAANGLLLHVVEILNQTLHLLASQNVDARIAHVLTRLADAHGRSGPSGVFVPLHIPRARLAEVVGCRVETLVRRLHGPPFGGLVVDRADGFVVRDLAVLRALSHEAGPA